MAKQAYYFPHDLDPTGDPKMAAMISEYGATGYGLFWRLVEMLHSDKNHRLPMKQYLYKGVAKQMGIEADFVASFASSCFKEFELFLSDGEYFWSDRVIKNIQNQSEKHINKSYAGKLGGIKSGESRRSAKTGEAVLQANEADENLLEANELKEKKRKENIIYKWETKPVYNSLNGLSENHIRSAQEFLKISQNVKATKEQIEGLWNIFKTQHLTGTNFYQTEDKVYLHFSNWVKTQKISSSQQPIKGGIHI